MLINILSWFVFTCLIFILTYQIQSVFRTNRPALNAVGFVFLFIFNTTMLLVFAGLLGWLKPTALFYIGLAGCLVVFLIKSPGKMLEEVKADISGVRMLLGQMWAGLPKWLRWVVILFGMGSALRFAFLIWALPPFVWDSLTYHLTNVAEWTQNGRIFLVDAPVTRVALPSNYEVFATWFTVFLHHDVIVEAAGIPSYLLAFLATYALARTLELNRTASWIAALGYISTPALILATTGTKNDPQMTALHLMAIVLVVDLVKRKDERIERNFVGQVVLLAMVLLYAFGTKMYILHLLPGLFFIGVLLAFQYRRPVAWAQPLRRIREELKARSTGARWLLAAGLSVAIFLGGFWYVRNLMVFRNPIYPFGLKYGDTVVVEAAKKAFPLGLERLPENLMSFAAKFGDKQEKIIPDLSGTTGWGWFAYGLGLSGFLWALIRRPKLRVLNLAFVISFIIMFISIRPSLYNMRYVIWFPAILALSFGAFYDGVSKTLRFERFAFNGLVTVTVFLNLWLTLNYNRISINQFNLMLSYPVSQRDTARLQKHVPEEYLTALESIPQGELLGYNVVEDGFVYPLYGADYAQAIQYVPVVLDESCESLYENMQARGVRWLFTSQLMTDWRVTNWIKHCEDDGYLSSPQRGLYVLQD